MQGSDGNIYYVEQQTQQPQQTRGIANVANNVVNVPVSVQPALVQNPSKQMDSDTVDSSALPKTPKIAATIPQQTPKPLPKVPVIAKPQNVGAGVIVAKKTVVTPLSRPNINQKISTRPPTYNMKTISSNINSIRRSSVEERDENDGLEDIKILAVYSLPEEKSENVQNQQKSTEIPKPEVSQDDNPKKTETPENQAKKTEMDENVGENGSKPNQDENQDLDPDFELDEDLEDEELDDDFDDYEEGPKFVRTPKKTVLEPFTPPLTEKVANVPPWLTTYVDKDDELLVAFKNRPDPMSK